MPRSPAGTWSAPTPLGIVYREVELSPWQEDPHLEGTYRWDGAVYTIQLHRVSGSRRWHWYIFRGSRRMVKNPLGGTHYRYQHMERCYLQWPVKNNLRNVARAIAHAEEHLYLAMGKSPAEWVSVPPGVLPLYRITRLADTRLAYLSARERYFERHRRRNLPTKKE